VRHRDLQQAQLKDKTPSEQCERAQWVTSQTGEVSRSLLNLKFSCQCLPSEPSLGAVAGSRDDLGPDASQFLHFLLHYKYLHIWHKI